MRARIASGDRSAKGLPAMSVRGLRLFLWLVLAVVLPVPIWLLGPGSVPALYLFELGSVATVFGLAEGLRGVVGLTALVFVGQAVVYLALLYGIAAVIARACSRHPWIVFVAAAALIVTASVLPIYHSPYNAHASQVTLLSVYP